MQNPGGEGMRVRYADGTFRELTKDEIDDLEALAQNTQVPLPTTEERLEALESVVLEILGVTTND